MNGPEETNPPHGAREPGNSGGSKDTLTPRDLFFQSLANVLEQHGYWQATHDETLPAEQREQLQTFLEAVIAVNDASASAAARLLADPNRGPDFRWMHNLADISDDELRKQNENRRFGEPQRAWFRLQMNLRKLPGTPQSNTNVPRDQRISTIPADEWQLLLRWFLKYRDDFEEFNSQFFPKKYASLFGLSGDHKLK